MLRSIQYLVVVNRLYVDSSLSVVPIAISNRHFSGRATFVINSRPQINVFTIIGKVTVQSIHGLIFCFVSVDSDNCLCAHPSPKHQPTSTDRKQHCANIVMIHRGGQIIIMAFIFPLLSWPYLEHAQLDPFPIPSPSKYVVASNNIVITPTLPRHHFHTSNWLALGTDSYSWNLPNGNVHFDTPLSLLVGNGVSKKELVLFNPVFLGRYAS